MSIASPYIGISVTQPLPLLSNSLIAEAVWHHHLTQSFCLHPPLISTLSVFGKQWCVLSSNYTLPPSPCTAGGSDNTARAWVPDSPDCVVVYQGHGSSVNCIAASEANRELYTGSSDGTARSWDIETGQQLRVFDGHQSAIMCIKASGAPSVPYPVTHTLDVL